MTTLRLVSPHDIETGVVYIVPDGDVSDCSNFNGAHRNRGAKYIRMLDKTNYEILDENLQFIRTCNCFSGISYFPLHRSSNLTSSMNNALNTAKLLRKSEPEKTLIKAGLMDASSEELTADGKALFESFLISEFGTKFKKDVVDPILAAQKEEESK